jgi:hypothetical protein
VQEAPSASGSAKVAGSTKGLFGFVEICPWEKVDDDLYLERGN